jgi:hypothetical protein
VGNYYGGGFIGFPFLCVDRFVRKTSNFVAPFPAEKLIHHSVN